MFVSSPNFFLLLISNCTLLWSENKICIIFNPLKKQLGFVSWPTTWTVLENVHMHWRRLYVLRLLGEVFIIRNKGHKIYILCTLLQQILKEMIYQGRE